MKIHVLTLGTDEKATKLKLMQVKSKKSARKIKQPYIHTLSGFSYLTIFVKDVEMVLKRALEKATNLMRIALKYFLKVYLRTFAF